MLMALASTTDAAMAQPCLLTMDHTESFDINVAMSKKRSSPVALLPLPRRVRFKADCTWVDFTGPSEESQGDTDDAKCKDIVECQEENASNATDSERPYSTYPKAASLLHKACSLIRDEKDIHQLDSLALELALAERRDELRGNEFDISAKCVKIERIQQSRKRTKVIVTICKLLSSRMTTEERDQKLLRVSESMTKPARLLARVMGTSDAVAALVEHGR